MFIPFNVDSFDEKIVGLYIVNAPMASGTAVDIDLTDTVNVGASASLGFTNIRAGAVVPASITTGSGVQRELGFTVGPVTTTGPTLEERMLGISTNYLSVPVGYPVGVFKPQPGDIIGVDQYVGALASDSGATGILDITNTANLGVEMGIFQGRFRIKQSGDVARARYFGNTTGNSIALALFKFE